MTRYSLKGAFKSTIIRIINAVAGLFLPPDHYTLKFPFKRNELTEDCRKPLEYAHDKRVLIATTLGGYKCGVIFDVLVGVACWIRGTDVNFLLCDEYLPICQLSKISKIKPNNALNRRNHLKRLCATCYGPALSYINRLGFKTITLSKYSLESDKDIAKRLADKIPGSEIRSFTYDSQPLGEHAYAGAVRYYGSPEICGEKEGREILRLYLQASIITYEAVKRILGLVKYDSALVHHAIYCPQGIIALALRRRGVPFTSWNPAYRSQTFIFGLNDTYHKTMISDDSSMWEEPALNEGQSLLIHTYLRSRRTGSSDWISFSRDILNKNQIIGRTSAVSNSRKKVLLLTNVAWDAQLHYSSNVFNSMFEWLEYSVKSYNRELYELTIRVHPAEANGLIPSRYKVKDFLSSLEIQESSNYRLIDAADEVSTYTLIDESDIVVIYNTKAGIEAACSGKTVVVCGEAWIRGKGIGIDITDKKSYINMLSGTTKIPLMTHNMQRRALRYAYYFFFQKMVDFRFINSVDRFTYEYSKFSLHDLMPGSDHCLDQICKGIIQGSEILNPMY